MKPKQVKGVAEGIMGVASGQLKKHCVFKFAGMLNMKKKKTPATPARKNVIPFTEEPRVVKPTPASKIAGRGGRKLGAFNL